MPKWGTGVFLAGCLGLIGIQLIPVGAANPVADPGQALEATMPVPREIATILARACQDCHSNRTAWPWDSRSAAASWLLAYHVNEGRRELRGGSAHPGSGRWPAGCPEGPLGSDSLLVAISAVK